jgi:hypothetical protein
MGNLKFLGEVWAGRACARANEEDLTTCGKIWGQRGRRGQGGWIKGDPCKCGWRPLVAYDWATVGRSAVARSATVGCSIARQPVVAGRAAAALGRWRPAVAR